MDVFIYFRDFSINLIYGLPIGISSCILRMGFFLALCALLLQITFLYLPHHTVFGQALTAFLGFAISLYMPVEKFRESGGEFLAFLVIVSIFCMIFLPNRLSFWLSPRYGAQMMLRKIIKCCVWGLLIIQIIMWR